MTARPSHRETQRLIERISRTHLSAQPLDDAQLKRQIILAVSEQSSGSTLTLGARRSLVTHLFHAMRGLDVLQPLVEDPDITEIMVNGPDQVYLERNGRIEAADVRFDNDAHLIHVISRYFGAANRLINEQKPIADMRLADGSRVHAVLPPASPAGPVLCIRRFTGVRPDLDGLVERRMLTREAADFLIQAVRTRQSLFISGGTGTGKTTFLNALSQAIPQEERVITIEDAAELDFKSCANLVRLEARLPGPDGQGAITLSDLIRSSLRLRPDRIVVGEVRGIEAFDMIQAMQTGHPGSMSTGHGNSCEEMLERLSLLIMMASNLPWEACRRLPANALHLMVHLERLPDGCRQVREIVQVDGYAEGRFQLRPRFCRPQGEGLTACKD